MEAKGKVQDSAIGIAAALGKSLSESETLDSTLRLDFGSSPTNSGGASRVRAAALALFFFASVALCAARPQEPQGMNAPGPQLKAFHRVRRAVKHDLSPPLRSIPALRAPASAPRVMHSHRIPRSLVHGQTNQAVHGQTDPVVQSLAGELLSAGALLNPPKAGVNSDGVGANGWTPPDTNGAAGATQYVQWVNVEFAIFDKASGALVYGPSAGNTLWTGFGGPCETSNSGDPIAQYDKIARRWVLAQPVYEPPYMYCVAVSTTSDATGSYNRYSFSFDSFPYYPKLGVWPDAYYASFNLFGPYAWGAEVCAFDRNAMLAGDAATAQCFLPGATTGAWSLLPSDLDGSRLPPAGAPNYFLSLNYNSLDLWQFHVDWAAPANSTFTGPTNLPVAPFDEACCIPQLGTSQQLDTLSDRLMYRLAYRNDGHHESLVANHSVMAGSVAGVRWYELRSPGASPTVYQQGTYAPDDGNYRWMGSIAMDKAGDLALGYSVSGDNMYPAIRYTGRTRHDPLGTMESETSIVEGAGSQQTGIGRWGDFSSMAIDPVDDCTFWYTNEYLQSDGWNWSTRIASFQFPSCRGPAVSLSPFSLTFPNQTEGTTSAVESVTLTNTGNAALRITGAFGISGDFAFGDGGTCPAVGRSVAAGQSCTITVVFTPTATGTRTGTVTLYDNAPDSPQTISLTGTGVSVSLSPASLSFGNQRVRTTSSAQTVALTNAGSADLNISSIAFTGDYAEDFAQTNDCGNFVGAGASCAIHVTFTPRGPTTFYSELAVIDDASGSPQTVSVTGTGLAPLALLYPPSLSFGNQQVGTPSATQTVTLLNGGNAPLTIYSISVTGTDAGDFAEADNCGASLAAESSCTISMTFMPTAVDARAATLAVSNNSFDDPQTQTVSLSGIGR